LDDRFLAFNTTGSNNIGLGFDAGFNLTTGSNDIDIGSVGATAESNTIRIGAQGAQSRAYMAGISGSAVSGSAVSGSAVVVNGAGQLGIVVSSARYKRDIHDMREASARLMKLRPVTFRYKNDPEGIRQYGLVAEEVARVYPELVTYGADGKVETVNYLTLTSMLLNELQKRTAENQYQAAENRLQAAQLTTQARQIAALSRQLAVQRETLEERLSTLERAIAAKEPTPELAAVFSRW
jgi:hypothetical protein